MDDNFNNWVKEILLESNEIKPDQIKAFFPFIEKIPEERSISALEALILNTELGKGLVAVSKRPRNIFFNLKGFFTGAVATALGIGGSPLAGVFLGLVAISQFVDAMSVELSEDHAEVILWLWDEKYVSDWVFMSDLKSAVGNKLKRLTLEQIIEDLEKLRAIEIVETEDIAIWKTEYLIIKSSAVE